MNTHAEKTPENKSQSVANLTSQTPNNTSATLQLVDNRPSTIAQRKLQQMANSTSLGTLQMMRAGRQQDAEEERARVVVTPGIGNVTDADRTTARDAMTAARDAAENAVNANVLVAQGHGGNMAELRTRWHNDQVHRLYRGGLEEGHLARTRMVEAAYIERRAAEIAATRAREEQRRNQAIQANVVQL